MERKLEELFNSVEGIERVLRKIIYELSRWRDVKSEFANQIGTRRENASPKLSESALGSDTGKEFDDECVYGV